MAIVKSDIGGNITVSKSFCIISIILVTFKGYLPFFYAGK
jgi:hypothetical protein